MKQFILLIIIVLCAIDTAAAQENKKILERLEQLENSMKRLVEKESIQRRAEYAELSARIRMMSGGKEAVAGPGSEQKKEETKESVDTKKLIGQLQAGNLRYVSGKLSKKEYGKLRTELAKGQEPFTIILSCSDSRVPPEIIFDETLGRLFIIRVAGNILDSCALGSIEYAVEHLHAHMLVVLGHSSCGAVKATIAGGQVPPNIGSLVWRIKPAVEKAKSKKLDEKSTLTDAIEENVREQIAGTVKQSTVLKEAAEKGELAVVGAVYDLESGKVEFIEH